MILWPTKPVTQKRLNQILKGRNTQQYRDWREAVLIRDDHQCQYPMCTKKDKLEIHHIRTYAKNPHLKTAVFNGIALCHTCHRKIQGNERAFEFIFFKIVRANTKKKKMEADAKKQAENNS